VLTSLITLPIRVGLRGAELGLRVGQAVAERGIHLVGEILAPTARKPMPDRSREAGADRPGEAEAAPARHRSPSSGGDPRSAAQPPEESVAEEEAVAELRELRDTPAKPPPPPPPPSPTPPPPAASVHLADEDEVIEEVAEPGAEDGAGAQIHVAEPWEGYAQLKAADVVGQLEGRDNAELAAIELYELSHRQRQTVIDAVKKALRRAENSP
jgi:hypothetical protein